MLGALVLLGWGLYGIGMLLGAAARAVGVR